MAEPRFTPDLINAALDPDERIQYRNLVNLLLEGKVLNSQQQDKYDHYKRKVEAHMKSQSPEEDKEPASADPHEPGVPRSVRVPRRYTMTPEALSQRQTAALSPNKPASMEGNRNAWKHGEHVKNFINKLKPCKSTCPHYPCALVNEGETSPGEDCLDKADVISFYRAVHNAISNKNLDDFNTLAALQIGNTMKVVDMLIEDILRDGTVLKREKRDGKDNLITEYVTHPSLLALPKLIADLGLNPGEFNITPRSITKVQDGDKDRDTITDGFTRVAKAMKNISGKHGKANARDTDE